MRREKLYFAKDEEYCYPLQVFQDRINDGETEILLQVAKYAIGADFMWCKKQGEAFEKGSDNCGVGNCDDYKPRNGKNGCCIHLVNGYEPSGPMFTLTKYGLTIPTQEKG